MTIPQPRMPLLEFLWKRTAEQLTELDALQDGILAPFAKSGGLVDDEFVNMPLSQIPYDNPEAAARALRRQALRSEILAQLASDIASGRCELEAREIGSIHFEKILAAVLKSGTLNIDDGSFRIEGREFVDLQVAEIMALSKTDQVQNLVKDFIRNRDPEFFSKKDIQSMLAAHELKLTLNRISTILAAIGADPAWSAPGRRKRKITP